MWLSVGAGSIFTHSAAGQLHSHRSWMVTQLWAYRFNPVPSILQVPCVLRDCCLMLGLWRNNTKTTKTLCKGPMPHHHPTLCPQHWAVGAAAAQGQGQCPSAHDCGSMGSRTAWRTWLQAQADTWAWAQWWWWHSCGFTRSGTHPTCGQTIRVSCGGDPRQPSSLRHCFLQG